MVLGVCPKLNPFCKTSNCFVGSLVLSDARLVEKYSCLIGPGCRPGLGQ